jgi:hypothetical protein
MKKDQHMTTPKSTADAQSAAVRQHAVPLKARVLAGAAAIALDGEGGIQAEAHRDKDGRWVLATWNERSERYIGQTAPGANTLSYRTLQALRALGVRSYRSPAEAFATLMPPPTRVVDLSDAVTETHPSEI